MAKVIWILQKEETCLLMYSVYMAPTKLELMFITQATATRGQPRHFL